MIHSLVRRCALALTLCIALFATSRTSSADWTQRIDATFDQPFVVPGALLVTGQGDVFDAGNYVFRIVETSSGTKIVHIYSGADDRVLLATILPIAAYRVHLNWNGEPRFYFDHHGAPPADGSPVVLRKIFYPGENYGVEFVGSESARAPAAKSSKSGLKISK